MSKLTLKIAELQSRIGKNISAECGSKSGSWVKDDVLHCAHWVSHVIKWNDAKGFPLCDDPAFGAVRGVQAFALNCRNWRKFKADVDQNEKGCLLYVAPFGKFFHNASRDSMKIEGSRRHIGIYYQGVVFHYENNSAVEAAVAVPITETSGSKNFADRYTSADEIWASDFPKGLTVEILGSVRSTVTGTRGSVNEGVRASRVMGTDH